MQACGTQSFWPSRVRPKAAGLSARGSIPALVRGEIPDCQLAAFLMAVYFRGLSAAETAALTLAMRDSGETLRLPPQGPPRLDKHSTGGVGDKVSLPLAPLLACLGFRPPQWARARTGRPRSFSKRPWSG